MSNWIEEYNESSTKTKWFIFNWAIYGLALLITTLYCYARLDYVRSYRSPAAIRAETQSTTPQQNPTPTKNP